MLQDIKIIIEELIMNIQIKFLVFWQYDALNYWKIKEIWNKNLTVDWSKIRKLTK